MTPIEIAKQLHKIKELEEASKDIPPSDIKDISLASLKLLKTILEDELNKRMNNLGT